MPDGFVKESYRIMRAILKAKPLSVNDLRKLSVYQCIVFIIQPLCVYIYL